MSIWFDCSHKKTTFPITLPERARKVHPAPNGTPLTYVACLDCGTEIPYNWEMMKVMPRNRNVFKLAARQTQTAA